MTTPEDILAFWFPAGLDADEDTHRRQFEWWFRGGADRAIVDQYQPVLGAASRGELDHWADVPRGRLALIIVLDQFSRTVHRDTAQAFAQDDKALGLAMDGLDGASTLNSRQYGRKLSSYCPSATRSRSRCSNVAFRFAKRWSTRRQRICGRSRFGRHPHRNAVLGRTSTEDERAYLASGELVHRRSFQA